MKNQKRKSEPKENEPPLKSIVVYHDTNQDGEIFIGFWFCKKFDTKEMVSPFTRRSSFLKKIEISQKWSNSTSSCIL